VKITAVKTVVVNAEMRNWVFVRVETSEPGLYGWGEATLEWKTRSVVGAVQDLEPLILGRDPRDIEQLSRIMTKHGFWRIGVIGKTAMSGIEVALWDIFGKSVGLPVWRLLGGKTRDRVRVYTHLGMGDTNSVYETSDAKLLVDRGLAVVAKGYSAMKIVPIPYTHHIASPRQIDYVAGLMGALREAVGDVIDIMVDFHGRPASTSAALQYINALTPFRPFFVEEPVQPGDAFSMREVFSRSPCPVATGERLVDRSEFDELFRLRAMTVAQPDLCHVGGLSEGRKIAAMAEIAGVGIAPHNPLGPLASVAALHFDVATPNFLIQEEMSGVVPWFAEVMSGLPVLVDGHWAVPEQPGLGIEINERIAALHPYKPEPQNATAAVLGDGTIVDW
jgi:galactonate dehydratase